MGTQHSLRLLVCGIKTLLVEKPRKVFTSQVLHKYSEVTLPGDFRIMRKKDGSEAVVAAMSTTV